MERNNNSIMIFEIIRGGGGNGEKIDWGEIPACYTGIEDPEGLLCLVPAECVYATNFSSDNDFLTIGPRA